MMVKRKWQKKKIKEYIVWVEHNLCFNVLKIRVVSGKPVTVVEMQMQIIYMRDFAYEQNISLTGAMEKSHQHWEAFPKRTPHTGVIGSGNYILRVWATDKE